MATKENTTIDKGLKEYIVEYLHVTAKTHKPKGYRVWAGSKEEAIRLCPKFTLTGRVLKVGDVLSGLKVMTCVETLKSDRGCRVF